jgi:hypothetical protein
MVNETPKNCFDDRNIENQHAIRSSTDDESWSKKSLTELELDADQVLEDIRNIVSNVECATTAAEDVFNQNDERTLPTHELRSSDPVPNSLSSPSMGSTFQYRYATSPPSLTEELSPIARNSAEDIDDDSMRDELERLDAVVDAIRLSFDRKNFSSLQDNTSSPLFSEGSAGSDFSIPNDSSSKRAEKETVRTEMHITQSTKHVIVDGNSKSDAVSIITDLENRSADWIMALCIAFPLIASLWVWTIYTMIVVGQCELLNAEGVVRWPLCSQRIE